MNESLDLSTFTNCLLHLVASFIENKARDISVFMDLSERFMYIICEGVGIDYSNLKCICNKNYSGKCHLKNNVKESFTQILHSILFKSEKVVIDSTSNIHYHAYRVVFERGIKTKISKITPKKCICTEIVIKGLLSIFPHKIEKINIYEYFFLRSQMSAMALITYLIPIKVTDKKFGEVLKWPGKYTGLGSAFSALVQYEANDILPVYANFKNIRMKAFLGLRLQCNKYLQYIYVNGNFVMWKFLYRIFNHVICKAFQLGTIRRGHYFTFVLNIECPDTECLTYSRFITTEIRPKNINSIVICFFMLFNNIKMFKKCVRNGIKDNIDELNPFKIRLKSKQENRHNIRDIVFNQQCIKGLNESSNCFICPIPHDFKNLSNQSKILKCDLDFNYIGIGHILPQSWLELKQTFHFSPFILGDISMIYKVINHLLNRYSSTQARNRDFYYLLVDILFFVTYKPILKYASFKMESIDNKCFEIKEKSNNRGIENSITKFYGKRKCESIACSANNTDAINNGFYYLESNSLVNDYYSNHRTDILSPNTEIELNYSSDTETLIVTNQQHFRAVLPELLLSNNESSSMHLKKSLNENACQHFNIVHRNLYIPKGVSPIMIKKENINLKYETSSILSRNVCSIIDETVYNRNIGWFKKPKLTHCNTDIQLISKDLLKNINVIGQLDNKYILCAFDLKNQYKEQEKILIIFDQHGIDERVQLESLLIEFIDCPENQNLAKHFMERYWILLSFRSEELKLLLQFTNYFSKYGLEINSFSRETLTITSIPEILRWLAECCTTTELNYYSYLYKTLKQLVEEQLESILKTGCTTNVLPTILHKYICKKACSSAVKFGRYLSLGNCEDIVNKLAKCKIPFMCAHGRPTAICINGISIKNEGITPPSLGILKQNVLFEKICS